MTIPTETLSGDCPCCGQSIRDIDYFFHQPTGVLISRGKVVVLPQTHSVVFDMLRRASPKPVALNDIHRKLCSGRADGGISKQALQVAICHMRPTMEVLGFTIPGAFGSGGHYSLQINEHTAHACAVAA